MSIKESEIVSMFKETSALLNGHFKLSSGLHSGLYLQCALVLQNPEYAERLGQAIAEKFKDAGVTVVAGPAVGGIVIAHEVARALKVRCIFGERKDGEMKLRRGFEVSGADRALIVEDVITTGGSVKELAELVKGAHAEVIGIASIIDRSEKSIDLGTKKISLAKFDVKTFDSKECPLCKSKTPITKPGSRCKV